MKIRKDIEEKIRAYDEAHETPFLSLLSEKVSHPRRNDYQAGVIHGLMLALTTLGVITNYDAMDILDAYRNTSTEVA